MRKLLVIVASAAILGWAGMAQAGIMCGADTADKVSNTAGCQLGFTKKDFVSTPLQVNKKKDLMFGFDDWVFAQRDTNLNSNKPIYTTLDIGLSLTGNKKGGNWMIENIWSEVTDVMLVFRVQAANTDPDKYVGYLVTTGSTAGTYESPFINISNPNKSKNIKHVSAYVRGVSVPEPGPLALLGLGLALMGWVHCKKRF